jgi:hypothetical protein
LLANNRHQLSTGFLQQFSLFRNDGPFSRTQGISHGWCLLFKRSSVSRVQLCVEASLWTADVISLVLES